MGLVELIAQRRRQIAVHSFIYYRLGTSIIDDAKYDRWARELHRLQTEHPEESAKAPYAEEFAGFDPATGFDLPHMPWVEKVAAVLLRHNDTIGG
jgi:NAD-dependent DNA ligase